MSQVKLNIDNKQKAIDRTEKFIEDYEKLLTQPSLSNSARERAEKDVEAMNEVLKIAVRYRDLSE
ncbi:hypothetical protein VXN63_02295 [Marinilactibacillus sp. XAAS-LB27]|uniref:hypothetical protein n=1 Tax=Marinilactibacillus sp. XAAS-LB27 TaxID=3114538 RepID=UPI002E183606|nr:hypothetical protein [Marinilactibacillus sp. XAAS-LB27]